MKFTILESCGKTHEFVFTRERLGQEVLDKVCDELGIKEKNYFGLKHHVNDTSVWLNLRNPVLTQLRPHLPGKPHRLRLEVKFFVAPQELQQEETRWQFYFCLKNQIANGKFNLTQEKAVQLCALMAQAEYGDFSRKPRAYPAFLSPWPQKEMEMKVTELHIALERIDSRTARNLFLQEMSKEELYDTETFKAKAGGDKVLVAVGSSGLKVYERKAHGKVKQIICFENITKMNLSEERLILVMKKTTEENRYNFVHFFLSNSEGAKAMHKAVLEHQLFYYSPKVRKSVIDHYLLSMPCWALPAKWFTKIPSKELYHLDVKLTRRQSHDHHYDSLLYKQQNIIKHEWVPKCSQCKVEDSNTLFCPCGHMLFCSKCAENEEFCPLCTEPVNGNQKVFFAMDTTDNDLTCQICMDAEVNTAFCPCGHVYCCQDCASNLYYCPLCKAFITFVQRIHVQFPCVRDEEDLLEKPINRIVPIAEISAF